MTHDSNQFRAWSGFWAAISARSPLRSRSLDFRQLRSHATLGTVVQLLMQGKRRQRSDRLNRGAWRCMQRSSIDRFLNCKLHHHLWICEILNTKSRKLQILKNLKMWKRHETVRVLRIFFRVLRHAIRWRFCGFKLVSLPWVKKLWEFYSRMRFL